VGDGQNTAANFWTAQAVNSVERLLRDATPFTFAPCNDGTKITMGIMAKRLTFTRS